MSEDKMDFDRDYMIVGAERGRIIVSETSSFRARKEAERLSDERAIQAAEDKRARRRAKRSWCIESRERMVSE